MSKARDYRESVMSGVRKLKNRRVKVWLMKDGSWVFKYTRLTNGVPDATYIRLSNEALHATIELCANISTAVALKNRKEA